MVKKMIKAIYKLSLIKCVYYNFLCPQITRDKGVFLFVFRGTHIQIAKTAHMTVHANMYFNINKTRGSKAECLVQLREGARMTVNGRVDLYYGTTIQVHNDAELIMGETHMNTGGTLICAYKITMGQLVSMGRGVFIFDSDHHPIYNAEGKRINEAKEILIGDRVWLGLKSTVMKGTEIGSDTVIGAHSLVSGKIPEHCMVATAPARPVMKDISWER